MNNSCLVFFLFSLLAGGSICGPLVSSDLERTSVQYIDMVQGACEEALKCAQEDENKAIESFENLEGLEESLAKTLELDKLFHSEADRECLRKIKRKARNLLTNTRKLLVEMLSDLAPRDKQALELQAPCAVTEGSSSSLLRPLPDATSPLEIPQRQDERHLQHDWIASHEHPKTLPPHESTIRLLESFVNQLEAIEWGNFGYPGQPSTTTQSLDTAEIIEILDSDTELESRPLEKPSGPSPHASTSPSKMPEMHILSNPSPDPAIKPIHDAYKAICNHYHDQTATTNSWRGYSDLFEGLRLAYVDSKNDFLNEFFTESIANDLYKLITRLYTRIFKQIKKIAHKSKKQRHAQKKSIRKRRTAPKRSTSDRSKSPAEKKNPPKRFKKH